MKKLIGLAVVMLGLAGCGNNTLPAGTVLGWNNHLYKIGKPTSSNDVGKQLGKAWYHGVVSGSFTLFEIPGVDPSEAIVFESSTGQYYQASTEDHALSFTVPNDTDVKSMTASVSILPGSTKKTFTGASGKATIDRILTWLKNSEEVGVEKPPIGKGGYPPTLQIALNDGSSMVIGPAVDWSSKELANGTTEITGTNVVGYVAVATSNDSKVVRLHSPELYKWIVNHEWK